MAVAYVRSSGDEGALAQLLAYVGGDEFIQDASDVIAAAALKEVQDGFNQQRDPYGDPWAPLRYRRGKILQKSGRMYRSAAAAGRNGIVEVAITADYAVFHQDGTKPHARKARMQPVNAAGRFVSRDRAAKYKRRVDVRAIPGHANGGIPRRPMVPDDRGLPAQWGESIDGAVDRLLARAEARF